MNRRKIAIWSSLTILASITGWYSYTRIRGNKIYNDLKDSLPTSGGITGTIADLKETDNAFNPNYWANATANKGLTSEQIASKVLKEAQAKQVADTIYGNVNSVTSLLTLGISNYDQQTVDLIKALKSKAQVSHVAYYYLKSSSGGKQTLFQAIKKMNLKYSDQIMAHLKTLPDIN